MFLVQYSVDCVDLVTDEPALCTESRLFDKLDDAQQFAQSIDDAHICRVPDDYVIDGPVHV